MLFQIFSDNSLLHMKIVGKIPSSHKWIIMLKLMMLDNYKVNTISQTFITP